jgi:hypothetical protein
MKSVMHRILEEYIQFFFVGYLIGLMWERSVDQYYEKTFEEQRCDHGLMDHFCVCVSIFFIDLAGIYVHCFGLLPQLFSLTHYSQCNMIVAVWGVVMAD